MIYAITGGTGLIGSALAQILLKRGDTVYLFSSRGKSTLPDHKNLHSIQADTSEEGAWQEYLAGCDAVINLAGRSVFHLWSSAYKKKIMTSRILTTKNVVRAMGEGAILLSGSAAGFYGNGGGDRLDESAPCGQGFLAQVCREWEEEAICAEAKGCRVVTMRFAVVLSCEGGALATMKTPYSLGLAGPLGHGRQYFPWIHIEDLLQALLFLLENSQIEGACNIVAPQAVQQREFARIVARGMGRPAFFPTPAFLVKSLLGEFGSSLLNGQYVVPEKLLANGFLFRYGQLEDAVKSLLS